MKFIKQVIGLFFVSLMFSTQMFSMPARAQTTPDIDLFFPKPNYGGLALSPSGQFLAFPDYRGHEQEIVVFDLKNKKELKRIILRGKDINWVKWATDDRLIAGVSYMVDGYIKGQRKKKDIDGETYWVQEVKVHRVMAIDKDGERRLFFFESAGENIQRNTGLGKIEDILPKDPDHILMPAYDEGYSLWKMNIHDGNFNKIEQGTPNTFDWKTNQIGQAVVRYESFKKGKIIKISVRNPSSRQWQTLVNLRKEDLDTFNPIGPTNDPSIYYVSGRPPGFDKVGIFKYDLREKKFLNQISSNDDVDLHSALIDDSGKYYGSIYYKDRFTYDFLDNKLNAHMKALNTFFDNENNVLIEDVSANGLIWILYVSGPREPGSYYAYNTKTRKAEFLVANNYGLAEEDLNKIQIVNYAARDGSKLSGYLTIPTHPLSTPAPLIVIPHGGPHTRDYYDYDRLVQYLASSGYQIFQPNFRGSRGFGQKFEQAGYKEWGGLMQDDVTNGVKHLINTGKVDENLICIMGLSYGGFSALSGATKTPDLYQCAVSINGVSDLKNMIKYDLKRFKGSDSLENFVKNTIGNLKTDKAMIKERSPINNIHKIKIPILLIHGNKDEVVPVEQSRAFQKALQKTDIEFQFFELKDTNHNLINVRNTSPQSNTYYDSYKVTIESVESFLSQHLDP